MLDASTHEDNASAALHQDDTATATVSAVLALAAAIEHLAKVLERQQKQQK